MSRPSLTFALNLLSLPLALLPKSFWLWGAHAPSLWAETSPRFIQVCLMLHWGSPILLWHLKTVSLSPPSNVPFCLRQ
jgi:hypothetical protein